MARAVALAVLLIAGCSQPQPLESVTQPLDAGVSSAVEAVQAVLPVLDDAALTVTELLPPQAVVAPEGVDPAAVALVVRWEVGSKAQYTQRYRGVICPGGDSGPTIGIGYDLGTQTRAAIRESWGWHSRIKQLETASGQTGPARCKAWKAANPGITVFYEDALRVFETQDWPVYVAATRRAYNRGWGELTLWHQGGLASNSYNRGFSFIGDRRREMRTIRDRCVPKADASCSAAQLRASCWVWEGTDIYKGICARRFDEAAFVESGA